MRQYRTNSELARADITTSLYPTRKHLRNIQYVSHCTSVKAREKQAAVSIPWHAAKVTYSCDGAAPSSFACDEVISVLDDLLSRHAHHGLRRPE